MDKKTSKEVNEIVEEVTRRTLKSIGIALQMMPGGGPPPSPGYGCQGLEFHCNEEYTCEAPDYCDNDFTCKKSYTPAARANAEKTKDCHYDKHVCDEFTCKEEDNYQCGLVFTCKTKFTG